MKLAVTLSQIQSDLKVGKTIQKQGLRYKYRSAEQILEALKPLLKASKTFIQINEDYIDGGLIKSTASISDGVETISSTAIVGVDFEQKGMAMPQRFGSASSYGKKYALGNLFAIDDTEDADALAEAPKKAKPKMTTEQLDKAIKFIKSGGAINSVKQKYCMTETQESMLRKHL